MSLSAFTQSPPAGSAQTSVGRREFRSRQLKITDADANVIHELRVAAGAATTLVLQQPLAPSGGAILAAPRDVVPGPMLLPENKVIVLSPLRDLAPGETFPLTLTFADGAVQSFRLVSVPGEVDIQVGIELALQQRATPTSAAALNEKVVALQARLDECESKADAAGVARVTALILAQDFDKPAAYTVERNFRVHHLDKQSRLLVQVRAVYRLFGQSYVVLTVENRHPEKLWMLERAEVAVSGSGASSEAKVLTFRSELQELPPGETTKVTVAYTTPAQVTGQKYVLRLFERGGSRHVELTDVEL